MGLRPGILPSGVAPWPSYPSPVKDHPLDPMYGCTIPTSKIQSTVLIVNKRQGVEPTEERH
jgi:hypothetical protein